MVMAPRLLEPMERHRGGFFGMSCAGPGVGLINPRGSLPTQDIL